MKRITSKDFYIQVEALESMLCIKLNTNVWMNHRAVYVALENGACGHRLVCGTTFREACDQIWAIKNALYLVEAPLKLKEARA